MKKVTSLILVLTLCLSLCACGVDEQYKPLLEYLKANDYEGIKTELDILSPGFAAEQDELARYRKYASLIDSLEKEDYEGAVADLTGRIPVAPEPTYHEQTINMDNWETYFEIIAEEDWLVNGFGGSEGYLLTYKLKAREEYWSKIGTDDIDLSVELTYHANYYRCTADLAAREIITGAVDPNIAGSPTGTVSKVCDISWLDENGCIALAGIQTFLIQWDDGRQHIYLIEEMPEVTRIQGTIMLQDK